MQHATATLLALSLGCYSILQAQLPIETGQRVRITSAKHGVREQAGHVLSATGDSVVIVVRGVRTKNYRQDYGVDTIALNLTAIDRLEVSKPGFRATKRGMRIGAALGMVAGFAYAIVSYNEQCPGQSDNVNCTVINLEGGPVVYELAGAAGGALIGAGIGALIGSAFPEHRWVTVPTHRASVVTSVLPAGGLGVGLTMSL